MPYSVTPPTGGIGLKINLTSECINVHWCATELSSIIREHIASQAQYHVTTPRRLIHLSIYLSIGINVRFAAMMADVGDGLL